VRVVDGDTIVVSIDGTTERVRYIGIDTPESVKPGVPVQCWAKRASALNRSLVSGRTVRLTFDHERRDRYGRLLAYVTREDGLDVNGRLLQEGAARTLEISPNTSRASSYRKLQSDARSRSMGLWSVCEEPQETTGLLVSSSG
jgi:micrococcal nuclease